MKKLLLFIFVILSMLLLITACKSEKRPEYHTVNFDSNGAVSYQSRAIETGNLIVEPKEPVRVGYNFLGWYENGRKWDFVTDTVISDLTLRAEWERIIHTVKFDSNGGSDVDDQTVASGDLATEPAAPTRKNYKFLGWFYNDEPWNFENYKVLNHITLVAKWEPYPTYTVTFDTKGGTAVDSQYIILGNTISMPTATTKANYKFVGWYYNGSQWNFETGTVTSNITLEAKWEPLPTYTVKFDSNGGLPVASQYVVQGGHATAKTPSAPSDRVGTFIGWYIGDTEWDFETPINKDITLTAKWLWFVEVTFDVQYPGTDTVISERIYIDENTSISEKQLRDVLTVLNIEDSNGYAFKGWTNNEKYFDFTTKVTSNITLTAKWEKIIYTVKFDSNGGSDVDDQTVASGDLATEPAAPTRKNYKFLGWFYNDEPWNFENYKVLNHITLVAKWEPYPTYTVTFDTKGGTAVDSQYIILGNTISMPTATTKANYKFVGWYYNGSQWNFETGTVTSNITLEAKWEPLPTYTVKFDSNGGLPVASQYVVQGGHATAKTPSAPSDRVGTFIGWYIGDTEWDFETPINKDITLTAKWLWFVDVTFNVQHPGTDTVISETISIAENTSISEKQLQDVLAALNIKNTDRYVFKGWTKDGRGFDFTTKISEDTTLAAKWTFRHKVNFIVQYPGEKTYTEKAVFVDENTVIPTSLIPTVENREDCVFKRWLAENGTDFDFTTRITSDITLKAFFNPLYTVTFTIIGAGVDSVELREAWVPIKVEKGELIPALKIPAGVSGFDIDACYVNGNVEWDFENDRVYSDLEITVYVWESFQPISPGQSGNSQQSGITTPPVKW